MKFTDEEFEVIKIAVERLRISNVEKLKEWEKINYENCSLKGLFANEGAFIQVKDNTMKQIKVEIKIINEIQKKIEESEEQKNGYNARNRKRNRKNIIGNIYKKSEKDIEHQK